MDVVVGHLASSYPFTLSRFSLQQLDFLLTQFNLVFICVLNCSEGLLAIGHFRHFN